MWDGSNGLDRSCSKVELAGTKARADQGIGIGIGKVRYFSLMVRVLMNAVVVFTPNFTEIWTRNVLDGISDDSEMMLERR